MKSQDNERAIPQIEAQTYSTPQEFRNPITPHRTTAERSSPTFCVLIAFGTVANDFGGEREERVGPGPEEMLVVCSQPTAGMDPLPHPEERRFTEKRLHKQQRRPNPHRGRGPRNRSVRAPLEADSQWPLRETADRGAVGGTVERQNPCWVREVKLPSLPDEQL